MHKPHRKKQVFPIDTFVTFNFAPKQNFLFPVKKPFFIPFHCSMKIGINTRAAGARGAFNALLGESSSEGGLQRRLCWLE